jgi:hypothetical protein
MRITVYDIFSYLAAGMTEKQILEDFPYLTAEDIHACYAFAADREDTPRWPIVKLLFDHNLSPRLVKWLAVLHPHSSRRLRLTGYF